MGLDMLAECCELKVSGSVQLYVASASAASLMNKENGESLPRLYSICALTMIETRFVARKVITEGGVKVVNTEESAILMVRWQT